MKKLKYVLKMNLIHLVSDIAMIWFHIRLSWAKLKAGGDASKIPADVVGKLIGKITPDQERFNIFLVRFFEVCKRLNLEPSKTKFGSIVYYYGEGQLDYDANLAIDELIRKPKSRLVIYNYMRNIEDISEKQHSDLMWSAEFHSWLDELV